MLHLGTVKEIAEVYVNEQKVGVSWMVPYRLDITSQVRPGENRIAVKVTNVLINRVLGAPKPDTSALLAKFGDMLKQEGSSPDLKFEQNYEKAQVKEPLLSGLLGPVEIRPFLASAS